MFQDRIVSAADPSLMSNYASYFSFLFSAYATIIDKMHLHFKLINYQFPLSP